MSLQASYTELLCQVWFSLRLQQAHVKKQWVTCEVVNLGMLISELAAVKWPNNVEKRRFIKFLTFQSTNHLCCRF